MKIRALLPILLLTTGTVKAQHDNPFAGIGKKATTITLSNGRYNENDENGTKRFIRMGSVVYDTQLKKVVEMLDSNKMVKANTTDSKKADRWFQIDPHADSYTSWSPYTFGKNNPIKFNDPTGMDDNDFQLAQNGQITLIKTTDDKNDRLYASTSNGQVDQNNSLEVSKGILDNVQSGQIGNATESYNYNYMEVSGTGAQAIFEFAANNTNVEWSIMKFTEGDDYVSTSHQLGAEAGSNAIFKNAKQNVDMNTLVEDDHSHPGGVHEPSGRAVVGSDEGISADIAVAKYRESVAPNVKFNIYTPSDHQYTPYSSQSHRPELNGVNVTPQGRQFNLKPLPIMEIPHY